MKLLIASDIHGSAVAAGKLLEHFRSFSCDYMLLLGDLLNGYGRVVSRTFGVNSACGATLAFGKNNAEASGKERTFGSACNPGMEPGPMTAADFLNEIAPKIYAVCGNCDSDSTQEALEFPMEADYLQIPIGGHLIFASHGHYFNPYNLPPIGSGDILMTGHTHIAGWMKKSDMLCCNPGSAALPRGGGRASFIVFDGKLMEWKYVEDGRTFDNMEL